MNDYNYCGQLQEISDKLSKLIKILEPLLKSEEECEHRYVNCLSCGHSFNYSDNDPSQKPSKECKHKFIGDGGIYTMCEKCECFPYPMGGNKKCPTPKPSEEYTYLRFNEDGVQEYYKSTVKLDEESVERIGDICWKLVKPSRLKNVREKVKLKGVGMISGSDVSYLLSLIDKKSEEYRWLKKEAEYFKKILNKHRKALEEIVTICDGDSGYSVLHEYVVPIARKALEDE